MRRWRKSTGAVFGAALFLVAAPGLATAAPCDENNPASPARTTQITLGASDFTDYARDDMRTFVATDSLGQVTARIIAQVPRGIVQSFSAVPVTNRYSWEYGEALHGIDVHVVLKHRDPAAQVRVSVRQVCAQYFRDSFLY